VQGGLESIQDLNLRLGIKTKVRIFLKMCQILVSSDDILGQIYEILYFLI
jgi:hypothetical protein